MARPMIKEACMASLLLENPYYILLWKTQQLLLMSPLEARRATTLIKYQLFDTQWVEAKKVWPLCEAQFYGASGNF